MVEDVECLYAKFHTKPLCQSSLFNQGKIYLPGIQSANKSVRGISIASKEALGSDRRSREGSGIDQRHTVMSTSWKGQGNAGNHIRPLICLIVAVRKQVGAGKAIRKQGVVG